MNTDLPWRGLDNVEMLLGHGGMEQDKMGVGLRGELQRDKKTTSNHKLNESLGV